MDKEMRHISADKSGGKRGRPIAGLAISLVLLAVFSLIFLGCSSNNPGAPGNQAGNNNPRGNYSQRQYPGRNGNFTGAMGNLTAEQRQALMEQRLNESISACQNLAAGDNCTITSQRGAAQGTCQLRNETLMCNAGMGGRRPPTGQPGSAG
jgi:hypothetical protein